MKNLYRLSKLSDSEFLSFLYAERERQDSMGMASGWSLWALVGSAFALIVFVYSNLKEVPPIDFLLCYYIFLVVFPIVLYAIYMYEQTRCLRYGDSIHVEYIKNIAPISLLSCLFIVYSLMAIAGFLLGATTISIISCLIVVIPLVTALVTICLERYKITTTFLGNRMSSHDWWNKVLLYFISGSIMLPLSGARRNLEFGYSVEFEITIAVILILAIVYLTVQNLVSRNKVGEVDQLIDGFLYRGWTKQGIVRKLELVKLGKAPFMELEDEYNKVVEASGLISETKKKTTELAKRIEEKEQSCEELCGLLNEVRGISSEIDAVLESQSAFLEKAESLIKLKTTLRDDEFRAMLDTAYDIPFVNQLFGDCRVILGLVNEKIVPGIKRKLEEKRQTKDNTENLNSL